MRISQVFITLALSVSFLITGCGEDTAMAKELMASAKGAFPELDLSSLSADDMKAKFGELTTTLVSKLGNVKDTASAEVVRDEIAPAVKQLGMLKGALGDNLPSLDSLTGAVQQVRSKFTSSGNILEVLNPVLEKLLALGS